jgi:hypothetical protein
MAIFQVLPPDEIIPSACSSILPGNTKNEAVKRIENIIPWNSPKIFWDLSVFMKVRNIQKQSLCIGGVRCRYSG